MDVPPRKTQPTIASSAIFIDTCGSRTGRLPLLKLSLHPDQLLYLKMGRTGCMTGFCIFRIKFYRAYFTLYALATGSGNRSLAGLTASWLLLVLLFKRNGNGDRRLKHNH